MCVCVLIGCLCVHFCVRAILCLWLCLGRLFLSKLCVARAHMCMDTLHVSYTCAASCVDVWAMPFCMCSCVHVVIRRGVLVLANVFMRLDRGLCLRARVCVCVCVCLQYVFVYHLIILFTNDSLSVTMKIPQYIYNNKLSILYQTADPILHFGSYIGF